MPGELKPRRRRGSRGRGRRKGAGKQQKNESTETPTATAGAGGAAETSVTTDTPPPPPPKEKGAERGGGDRGRAADPGNGSDPEATGAGRPASGGEQSLSGQDGRITLPGEKRAPKPRASRSRSKRVAARRRSRMKTGEARAASSTSTVPSAPAQPETTEAPEQESGVKAEEKPRAAERRPSRRRARSRSAGRSDVVRTLVINRTGQETRLAILEQDSLAEIFIERESSRTVVGNVYKGRVTKVLPGMQSAFVAVGLERDAFLYVSDLSPGYDAYEGLLDLDQVEGGDAIREAAPKVTRESKIENLIKEGQELLVQVTKEPIGTKGARITSYVTLPGRFLVLMPQVDHVGVSRKIGDARERGRLRKILDKVRVKGMGFIVRTVADGCDASELEADARYLISRWEEIRSKAEKGRAPCEIQRELSVVPKVLRDLLTPAVAKIVLDDESIYNEAMDLVKRLMPDMADRLVLYKEPVPIFEKYGVQADLDRALKSRVWLRSGGSIVINQTEALVAIDVNTGKFVGKRNLEDTVLKTNLEAATEIVRQLRLRDLGGIIVVDFIDMEERKSKKKLIEAFEKELQKDRARTKVLQISDFGLVEITRQRTKKSLERILLQPCPYCTGSGKIKSGTTVLLEIRRELEKLIPGLGGRRLVIRANPQVALQLESERKATIGGIPKLEGVDLSIRSDSTLHHEQFEITSI